jgi:hypothetical protein
MGIAVGTLQKILRRQIKWANTSSEGLVLLTHLYSDECCCYVPFIPPEIWVGDFHHLFFFTTRCITHVRNTRQHTDFLTISIVSSPSLQPPFPPPPHGGAN